MSLSQQYALDTYRLARQGLPAPPAPGTHEARVLRALWHGLRFRRRRLDRHPRRDSPPTGLPSAGLPPERAGQGRAKRD